MIGFYGEDIYIYSQDTLAAYLLAGYTGLSNLHLIIILDNKDDNALANKGDLSDIPSPTNDPLTDAHAPYQT